VDSEAILQTAQIAGPEDRLGTDTGSGSQTNMQTRFKNRKVVVNEPEQLQPVIQMSEPVQPRSDRLKVLKHAQSMEIR